MPFEKSRSDQYKSFFHTYDEEQGSCFYCHENKPLAHAIILDKGICHDCVKIFKIGHFGTDRFVIESETAKYKRSIDTIRWIKSHGGILLKNGEGEQCKFYIGINDEKLYEEYESAIYKSINSHGGYMMMNVNDFTRLSQSFNNVEIFDNGGVHIIY